MLNIKKILLPVDFPNASLARNSPGRDLAHHFNSEIVLLHVVTARSHAAGVPDGPEFAKWDLLAAMLGEAEKNSDQSLRTELQVFRSDASWSKAIR